MKFKAKVEDGKIIHSQDISELNGNIIQCNLSKIGNNRSSNQNSYYWGLVVPMMCDGLNNAGFTIKFGKLELPFTDMSVHELLIKGHFLKKYKKESTTKLSTIEFENLMKDVRQWASIQVETVIPLPNEDLSGLFNQINQYEKERQKDNKVL